MSMNFGFSAKNWLKVRYYMLHLEKSASQCCNCNTHIAFFFFLHFLVQNLE